jgi:hypothetical protein
MRRMTRLARWRLWARRASRRVAFGDLAFDVGLGGLVVALLGDAGDVEHAVDAPVPAVVEAVSDWLTGAFAGGQGDCAGAAPPSELRLAIEPCRVTDLADECRRGDGSDAGFVAQRGAVFVEQRVKLGFEAADLTSPDAVLVDEHDQPLEPIDASGR